mmetsp:Transcript_31647/g.84521  ORF Transcript_31647/g.84521 Transcript_31647/m.84521 type:complete len:86 (-) Transcript_31647:132-389(-)
MVTSRPLVQDEAILRVPERHDFCRLNWTVAVMPEVFAHLVTCVRIRRFMKWVVRRFSRCFFKGCLWYLTTVQDDSFSGIHAAGVT